MNLNVAGPWSEKCSPPQRPELAFYSVQSEDLLFGPQQDSIEIICQSGLRSVGMDWALSRNRFTTSFRQGSAEPEPANRFRIRIATAGLHPGFYDVHVKLNAGLPKPVEGVCTFGYRVGEMAIRDTRPADFDAFWSQAKAELAKVALSPEAGPMQSFSGKEIDEYNVKSACLPPDYDPGGHCSEEVESCKINFVGPSGRRVYGWLAKPKGPGPFPAMLVLPGAGFAARPRPLEHARHGFVALDIQVHSQDVDLPKYERLPGYYEDFVYQPISSYYYRDVYLRALQAVNYLASRADVDSSRIVAAGGSQGGRLSLVVAALDDRIKAIIPAIANSPNHPYLVWAKGITDGMDTREPPPLDTPEGRCQAYYDPMNFAPDIHCPVLINCGLIDPVSPPSSVFAVYNRLGNINKQMVVLPGLGHDWSAEFDRRAWRWIRDRLAESR